MDIEKLTQAELQRIEKYTDGIVSRKEEEILGELRKAKSSIDEVHLADLKKNETFKKLFKDYITSRNAFKKYAKNKQFRFYDDLSTTDGISKDYNVTFPTPPKSKKIISLLEQKREKLLAFRNDFREQLIFGDKPKILAVLKKMEKL